MVPTLFLRLNARQYNAMIDFMYDYQFTVLNHIPLMKMDAVEVVMGTFFARLHTVFALQERVFVQLQPEGYEHTFSVQTEAARILYQVMYEFSENLTPVQRGFSSILRNTLLVEQMIDPGQYPELHFYPNGYYHECTKRIQ